MSRRIRTIKPEFFDSPSTAKCTPWARLLFIAMWSMADDWGIGQANMKEMAAFAFPNDEEWTGKELPSLCKEVADNYGVMFYTHKGRPYYYIPSWEDHQVTQRRAKRRYPTHDDPESAPDLRFHPENVTSKELPSNYKENTSTEQGNRGTGEQGNRGTDHSINLTVDHAQTTPSRFEEFWNHYPRKVGKQKAKTKYETAIKKTDQQTIINAAIRLANDPNLPETQFIPHPTTWLERGGWDDEPLPPRNINNHATKSEAFWEQEMQAARQRDQISHIKEIGA